MDRVYHAEERSAKLTDRRSGACEMSAGILRAQGRVKGHTCAPAVWRWRAIISLEEVIPRAEP